MSGKYANPKLFWEERLSNNFDLTGVGYRSLGPIYNARLYQARLDALNKVSSASEISFAGKNILEVGCGTGFYTEYFKKQNVISYTGIDITEISIQTLTKRYSKYNFIQHDIGDDDFKLNNEFDIILAADILFHIVDDRRFATAIHNIGNSLKPGGLLLISDVVTSFTIDTKDYCKWRSFSEYETILSQQGILIRQIEPIFAILQPPVVPPKSSILWRIYAMLWRYGLIRLARWRWFDINVSNIFSNLDKKYFLKHTGIDTPNNKWFLATKNSCGPGFLRTTLFTQ